MDISRICLAGLFPYAIPKKTKVMLLVGLQIPLFDDFKCE
jgi:hypothetical protein